MGKKAWLVCLLKFCRKSHTAIGGFGIYMIYKTHSSICQAKDIFLYGHWPSTRFHCSTPAGGTGFTADAHACLAPPWCHHCILGTILINQWFMSIAALDAGLNKNSKTIHCVSKKWTATNNRSFVFQCCDTIGWVTCRVNISLIYTVCL